MSNSFKKSTLGDSKSAQWLEDLFPDEERRLTQKTSMKGMPQASKEISELFGFRFSLL